MNLATIACSTTDTGHWTSNNEPATMDFATIVSRRTDLAKINLATMYSATIYIENFFQKQWIPQQLNQHIGPCHIDITTMKSATMDSANMNPGTMYSATKDPGSTKSATMYLAAMVSAAIYPAIMDLATMDTGKIHSQKLILQQ